MTTKSAEQLVASRRNLGMRNMIFCEECDVAVPKELFYLHNIENHPKKVNV